MLMKTQDKKYIEMKAQIERKVRGTEPPPPPPLLSPSLLDCFAMGAFADATLLGTLRILLFASFCFWNLKKLCRKWRG